MTEDVNNGREIAVKTADNIKEAIAFALLERDRLNGDMTKAEYTAELKRLADTAELYNRLARLLTEPSRPQEQTNNDLGTNSKVTAKRTVRRKTTINKVGD